MKTLIYSSEIELTKICNEISFNKNTERDVTSLKNELITFKNIDSFEHFSFEIFLMTSMKKNNNF